MGNKNYTVKTINNISSKGLDLLKPNFVVSEVDDNPDAILVRSADLNGDEFSENLLYIGRAGAGVNNIPIERCSERGIVVCNAPGANANAVKELVAAALLISSRNIIEAVDWTRSLNGNGNIEKEVEAGKKNFIGPELVGKTLGVIGLGAVGGLVADMGIKFDMEVYGYDPYLSLESALHLNTSIKVVTDVKEIFKNCDYISLHTSLTLETKHFVNKDLFDIAKPGLRLMNFARGELVNLEDLKAAIDEKKVDKYICDFPCQESLELTNTINIPHLGASTPESEENSAKMVVLQMMDYLENGNIKNSVNFPNIDMGPCRNNHRVTVNHKNIPNMLGQITAIFASENINIAELANKHKNGWAYTMVDIDGHVTEELLEKLKGIEGVVKVRLVN